MPYRQHMPVPKAPKRHWTWVFGPEPVLWVLFAGVLAIYVLGGFGFWLKYACVRGTVGVQMCSAVGRGCAENVWLKSGKLRKPGSNLRLAAIEVSHNLNGSEYEL